VSFGGGGGSSFGGGGGSSFGGGGGSSFGGGGGSSFGGGGGSSFGGGGGGGSGTGSFGHPAKTNAIMTKKIIKFKFFITYLLFVEKNLVQESFSPKHSKQQTHPALTH
jgi:hypothetical protein